VNVPKETSLGRETYTYLEVSVKSWLDDANIRQALQPYPELSLDVLKVNICGKSSRAGNMEISTRMTKYIV
jgi:hypothetical protein